MDKKVILKIQLIIQDIVTNTDICNTELEENRPEIRDEDETADLQSNSDHLSNEIKKLNELLQSGVLTKEEFEKAKKKILDN